MAVDERLSVRDVADRLGVSEDAVRKRIASGELAAVKQGRDWRLDQREVLRVQRRSDGAGRALSPAMAWAVLGVASGDDDAPRRLLSEPRSRARVREWLSKNDLVRDGGRLRRRARLELLDAHPADLPRLRERSGVMLTGLSAGDIVGLVGDGSGVEMYAPMSQRDVLISDHGLVSGSGPVVVRWVSDDLWGLIGPKGHVAPRAAVLLDLLESDDPRARREATRVLEAA